MGLDMYLYKETYVSKYDFTKDTEPKTDQVHFTGALAQRVKPERVTGIVETVAVWRKVNCIHNWFVDNVQGGVDECQRAPVQKEQLEELLNLVIRVLANRSQAGELLPPQAGFFFGSTDIDEWYWRNLEETKTMLIEALEGTEDTWPEFYYQSSW